MFLFTLLIVEIFLYFIAYKMSNNDFISPTNFSIFIFYIYYSYNKCN